MELLQKIDAFFEQPASELGEDAREVFATFLDEIEAGRLRAASPDGNGGWVVEPAVKRGILLGFRLGSIQEMSVGNLTFSDKSTYPPQRSTSRVATSASCLEETPCDVAPTWQRTSP